MPGTPPLFPSAAATATKEQADAEADAVANKAKDDAILTTTTAKKAVADAKVARTTNIRQVCEVTLVCALELRVRGHPRCIGVGHRRCLGP